MTLLMIRRIVVRTGFIFSGFQFARRMFLISSRHAITRRRSNLALRTGMARFVSGALDLHLVGAAFDPIFGRRLMLPIDERSFDSLMRLVPPAHLAFPVPAMQPLAHLAEQRAKSLARGLDRPSWLNLAEDFENLGVHAIHQVLVRCGTNRVSNRLWIRGAVRDYRYPAEAEQRRSAAFRRAEPLPPRVQIFPHQQI